MALGVDDWIGIMSDSVVDEPVVFRVPESGALTRVDAWIASQLPDVTRAAVQRWIGEGRVLIEGERCRAKDRLRPGTEVEVFPDQGPATDAIPDPSVQLDIVFEDEHLLVVDKPPGLVVHPGRGHRSGTLVNGLLARPGFERAPSDPLDPGGHLRPGIVHRIDKETSGVLVVAKDARTREGLKRQLAAHEVEREYRAICVGEPPPGRIETLHGRDPRSRMRFSSKVTTGKRAVTKVSHVQTLPSHRATLICCRLETGRTHQIRVHLSGECGTPLLADALYGGFRGEEQVVQIGRELGRQALHAQELGFIHPISGERVHFRREMPDDMKLAWDRLVELG